MMQGLILATACAYLSTDKAPMDSAYKIELSREKDSIAVRRGKNRTDFVISSATGIGGATIRLTNGQWPEQVVLRFLDFGNLEDLRMQTDRILVEGGIKFSGRMRFCFQDEKGEPSTIQPGAGEPAGVMNVLVTERKGAIEVILPSHLLRGSSRLTFSWIDAYRR